MKFSYSWIQSYFDKKLPPIEKLADLLTTHVFETAVEGNDILNIEILANRVSDCASHLGIARECAAILNEKIKISDKKVETDKKLRTEDFVSLEVKNPELCLRYIALLCRNVKIEPSPQWLKDRLKSVGLRPIWNVVDIANYVMLETGQPLHTFDLERIGERKIVVRKAKEGEKMETLDNKWAVLSKDMLVIADGKEPMAVAGIKGGKKSGIGTETKDIVIEAAIFDHATIRQTSRGVGISTDASFRFEHGLSLFLPESAIKRTAQLIHEIAGGEVASTSIDFCPQKPILQTIVFSEEEVFKLLGKKIESAEILKILKNLGFAVEKTENKFFVTSPKERNDIFIKEDVIEEIARIYGHENIPTELPVGTKIPAEPNEEYLYSNWVRSILVNLGLSEVYNYSFWKTGQLAIRNPKSPEKAYLRTNLSDGLRATIVENFKNFDTVNIFEIGKVFGDEEKTHVAVALGDKKNKIDTMAELRGVAEALFISEADNYIKEGVFEIDLEKIIEGAKENSVDFSETFGFENKEMEYRAFSKYPAVGRDISLFVPIDARIEEVTDVIENTAGELLIDSDLFDEYLPSEALAKEGAPQKSLAFRLIFQSFDKTLTDKEVNEIMEKIIKALEQNIEWQVRK